MNKKDGKGRMTKKNKKYKRKERVKDEEIWFSLLVLF